MVAKVTVILRVVNKDHGNMKGKRNYFACQMTVISLAVWKMTVIFTVCETTVIFTVGKLIVIFNVCELTVMLLNAK